MLLLGPNSSGRGRLPGNTNWKEGAKHKLSTEGVELRVGWVVGVGVGSTGQRLPWVGCHTGVDRKRRVMEAGGSSCWGVGLGLGLGVGHGGRAHFEGVHLRRRPMWLDQAFAVVL